MNRKLVTKKYNSGFTLVEMLVSIAIFAIILTAILGIIVTIVDVNRKARTLSEVMNNLNFSLESITRTVKTGNSVEVTGSGGILEAIDNLGLESKFVKYKLDSATGQILKCRVDVGSSCESDDFIPITASDVFVKNLSFTEFRYPDQLDGQPRILITVQGEAQAARDIKTEFKIQTTVSQRMLNVQ